ncbi:putative Obtusifoliol 14-alpha demethylase [Hordeum vulgare]|nr:putative Obtusifoliol 14-alpha demethylase [Hordeum vulgare]
MDQVNILALAAFLAAAAAALLLKRPKESKPSAVALLPPPVASGVSTIAALGTLVTKGLTAVIHDLHAELGSVFTVSLLGLKKVTFLIGPEVTAHFFEGSESEIRQSDIYKITVPVFGRGVLFDVDLPTRRRQIRFLSDAIKPVKLRGQVDSMVREVEDYFGKWGEHGTVDLKQELGQVLMRIANRCLLGEHIRDNMFDEVSQLLHELFDNGFHLTSLFFPYLPIPPHRRRDAARAKLGEIFREAARSRRASGRAENDLLQKLVDSRYADGRSLTESEIAGLLIVMIFAGHHTSASAVVWTGACLLSHGDGRHLAAAVEEQKQIIGRHGRDRIHYDVLREMGTLHCCIKEALRMYAPTNVIIRRANKSFSVQAREGSRYAIPKGHTLVTPPSVNNRLPHIFKDPRVYDPSRFGPGREEDKVGGKFSFTTFSAGRHVCLGEDYAYMQIKAIWSHVLRNFELKIVSPFPEEEWEKVSPGPRGKVMVTYKRRLLK